MNENLKPGERGYQLTCGCCAGPENDRCCCHIHQDIPRGIWVKKMLASPPRNFPGPPLLEVPGRRAALRRGRREPLRLSTCEE